MEKRLNAQALRVSILILASLYISTSVVVRDGPPPSTRMIAKLVKQKRKTSDDALKIEGNRRGRVTVTKVLNFLEPSVIAACSQVPSNLCQ